jgi:hypothetical protein
MNASLFCQITYLRARSTLKMTLKRVDQSFIKFMIPLLEVTPESLTLGT